MASGRVRDYVSRDLSCPTSSIVVEARTDLRATDFDPALMITVRPATPEVLADPERYRLWEQERDRHAAQQDASYSVYVVHACSRDYVYVCMPMGRSSLCDWREERTVPSS